MAPAVAVAVVAARPVPLPQEPEVVAARPVPPPQEPAVAAVRPAVLLEVVEGRADLAHKLLPRVRPQVAVVLQGPAVRAPRVVVQVPHPPLLLNLLSFPLPQVEVESEVPVRLQGRPSFSAAMASSSLPTGKPTYVRAASTR